MTSWRWALGLRSREIQEIIDLDGYGHGIGLKHRPACRAASPKGTSYTCRCDFILRVGAKLFAWVFKDEPDTYLNLAADKLTEAKELLRKQFCLYPRDEWIAKAMDLTDAAYASFVIED